MKIYKLNTHTEIGTVSTPLSIFNKNNSTMSKTGSVLQAGTSWLVNQYIIDDNGDIFYQVATNEYVTFDPSTNTDVRLIKNLANNDATVTIQDPGAYGIDVVNDKGISISNSYSNGSSWTTDKVMFVNNKYYYRIAINIWASSNNCFAENKSGVINNQSDQIHKVVTTQTAIVYNANFNPTTTTEETNSGWLATDIKTNGQNNYYQIATNMWLIDSQVMEVLPYSMIIRINSLTPKVQDFQGNPVENTIDFGHQLLSKGYVKGSNFNGYLLTDNSIISIDDASGTTLLYGNYLG